MSTYSNSLERILSNLPVTLDENNVTYSTQIVSEPVLSYRSAVTYTQPASFVENAVALSTRVVDNSSAASASNVVVSSGGNCKFLPPIGLDQYKLNNDPNPEIVRKKPADKVRYRQDIAFRFLEPPQPPKHGEIVVKQLPNRQIAPAPPLIVRQAPPKPANPPPLVLREVPPPPPPRVPEKLVLVPGKVLAPPARKVVVERLPPIPAKPEQVYMEKWLPFKQPKRRVVFQPAEPDCVLPNPRNLVIQWQVPEVEITRDYRNLGTQLADPEEYVRRFGSELLRHEEFKSTASKFGVPESVVVSDSHRELGLPELEGDVESLRLVDLNTVGLVEYREYLSRLGVSFNASAFTSEASPYGFITSPDSSNLIPISAAQAVANDLNASPSEKPVTESDLRVYFNSIDQNGDGVISFEEFKNASF